MFEPGADLNASGDTVCGQGATEVGKLCLDSFLLLLITHHPSELPFCASELPICLPIPECLVASWCRVSSLISQQFIPEEEKK